MDVISQHVVMQIGDQYFGVVFADSFLISLLIKVLVLETYTYIVALNLLIEFFLILYVRKAILLRRCSSHFFFYSDSCQILCLSPDLYP